MSSIIAVRDVDGAIWKTFKTEVVRRKMNLGQALNMAIQNWVAEEYAKRQSSQLLGSSPLEFKGSEKKRLSESVDEVLYGE